MAYAEIKHSSVLINVKQAVISAGTFVSGLFETLSNARSSARELQFYSDMTDEKLMRTYGITREQVVQKVFGSTYS